MFLPHRSGLGPMVSSLTVWVGVVKAGGARSLSEKTFSLFSLDIVDDFDLSLLVECDESAVRPSAKGYPYPCADDVVDGHVSE